MAIFVWGISALELWRSRFDALAPSRALPQASARPGSAAAAIASLVAGSVARPVHVEVASAALRPQVAGVVAHVRGQPLPRGAYYRLGGSPASDDATVYVAGPEALFVQLAAELPFLELVALAAELCAGYVLRPGDDRGFSWRHPVATRRSLERFVARCEGARGVRAARRALPLVAEGALSPPEAKTALLAALSTRRGGYGCGMPLINCSPDGQSRVSELVEAADSGRGVGSYVCDLLWPERGVALEYQGREAHGTERLVRDAVRQVRLGAAGIDVVPLTHEQLNDALLFHEVMMALMRKSGTPWRCTVPDFAERRRVLRRALRCLSTGAYHLR